MHYVFWERFFITKNNFSGDLIAQFPKNLISNIAYFLANVLIGIFITPFFVSKLGVSAYGLIPLSASITGYAAIVIQSLNVCVSRFLTIDLQREDYAAANRTFNTTIFGLAGVIFLLIPIALAIAHFIPIIFNVPSEQENDSAFLFLGVCGAFFIRSWSGCFTVQLFAYNRLDLQNFVSIANLVIQTGIIIVLFAAYGPNLVFVGIAYLVGASIASIIAIILSRRICPHLKVSIQSFDRIRARDLCGMGWWVVINNIGALLFLQVDLIIVNLIFGATSSGRYAIALQWATLLRSIGGLLSGVIAPTIFSYYARGQNEALIRIAKSAVKLMGIAMALPIGLICGFAPQLLTAWVGSGFADLAPLMVLLTFHLSINLAVSPLFPINMVHNKVRLPGILTLVMGIGNFALAIALSLGTDWGYYSVALAGAIVLTLKNAFFIPWYSSKILRVDAHTFTKSIFSGFAASFLVGIMASGLAKVLPLFSLLMLAVAGISISLIYISAVWAFGLSEFERRLFESYLPINLRRTTA